MPSLREKYEDQFVENDWAYYLIHRVDLTKDTDTNLAILLDTKIKKDPLIKVSTYLKGSFEEKYPEATNNLTPKKPNITKNDLISQILSFVKLTLPNLCLKCQTEYNPYLQSDRSAMDVECFLCSIPAHRDCVKGDNIKTEEGIVFICHPCIQKKGKPDLVLVDDTEKPATAAESSDEFEKVERKKKRLSKKKRDSKHRHPEQSQQSESEEEGPKNSSSDSDSDNEKKMCSFFKQGTCRYGISGRSGGTCKFIHRKVCNPYRLYGDTKKGCRKKKCDYWHPPLCYKSVNSGECYKEKCRFWHLKGTYRIREDTDNQHTQSRDPGPDEVQDPYSANQRLQNVRYNQQNNKSADFLGQMRAQHSRDMLVMRQQQNVFMQHMTQQLQQVLLTINQGKPRQEQVNQAVYKPPQMFIPDQQAFPPIV